MPRLNPVLAGLTIGLAPLFSQSIFRKAPPQVEEALRARVHQFYSLYQDGKFRQAESLVAEESRELYYGMSKTRIRGFKVESIDFAEDFSSALVLVTCLSMHPRTAAANVPVPVSGKWKSVDGEWYLLIEKRETSPYGPMTFADPSQSRPAPFQRPTPETLAQGAFRVEPRKLVFPRAAREAVGRTVVISNLMPGRLSLEVAAPQTPALELWLSNTTIEAKGQVTLQVTYRPEKGTLAASQPIQIRLKPVNEAVSIEVEFQ